MRSITSAQAAILAGDAGGGFVGYLMQMDHPDGAVRFWSGASAWTDAAGVEWLGAVGVLNIGATASKAGAQGQALKIIWPGAPVALVTLARDGRVAGARFTLWKGFFAASGAEVGDKIQDFSGICEQPEIDADPESIQIILTIESHVIRLSRPRPVRLTPADWGRWFGTGADRDQGFNHVADLQNADPFK
jgi:hypothetical protein